MMGSGGGTPPSQAGVLDGLLALVSNPAEVATRLKQLQEAQAAHDAAKADAERLQDAAKAGMVELEKARSDLSTIHSELSQRAEAIRAKEADVNRASEAVNEAAALWEAQHREAAQRLLGIEDMRSSARSEIEAWWQSAHAASMSALQAKEGVLTEREATLSKREADANAREATLNARLDDLLFREKAASDKHAEYQQKLSKLKSLVTE